MVFAFSPSSSPLEKHLHRVLVFMLPHSQVNQLRRYQFGALDCTVYVIHKICHTWNVRRLKKLNQEEVFIQNRHNLGLNTIPDPSFFNSWHSLLRDIWIWHHKSPHLLHSHWNTQLRVNLMEEKNFHGVIQEHYLSFAKCTV